MRLLNLLTFILIFASCSNKEIKPKNILPSDTIINIITDMHIGDAIIIAPSVQQKPIRINSEKFYSAILSKHNVTKSVFEDNIAYYSSDTAQFKKIYEVVIQKLNTLQENLMKNDSIAKK